MPRASEQIALVFEERLPTPMYHDQLLPVCKRCLERETLKKKTDSGTETGL